MSHLYRLKTQGNKKERKNFFLNDFMSGNCKCSTGSPADGPPSLDSAAYHFSLSVLLPSRHIKCVSH
jgi:hypothetical protein